VARSLSRLLLLQMCGVDQYNPGELARRVGCDDFSTESSICQERQSPAMVEMSMGEEHVVYGRRVEPERLCILLRQLTTSLKHAAIDQDATIKPFHHMAGTGDAAIGAMK
jgi:hypothetical protein